MPQLRGLEAAANDEEFLKRWAAVKLQAKKRAAVYLKERTGVTVNPDVMFDVQVPPPAAIHAQPWHSCTATSAAASFRRPVFITQVAAVQNGMVLGCSACCAACGVLSRAGQLRPSSLPRCR